MNEAPHVARTRRFVRWFGRFWFRLELRGQVPEVPCLLVGNHNFGLVANPEIWILGSHVPGLKQLAHDLLFRVPGVRALAKTFGAIPARHADALEALRGGHRVAVFPGGAWESFRPSRERDRVDFKGRSGFVRLAREAGVPIVPVVTAGGHDGWWVFTRGERIAQLLPKSLRVDVFPIGFAAPLGFFVGPFVPPFPLPRRIISRVCAPIHVDASLDDATVATRVVEEMQRTLTELASELRR